jgi:hypothetical protein
MKTLEPKSISSQAQKKAPFFSKDINGKFFRASAEEKFFPKNSEAIQEKLIVGEPDDRYEKEADEMAEKVVQHLTKPDIKDKKIEGVQAKLLAGSVAPVLQSKPAPAEEELQMKEEDLVPEGQLDVQQKPIFEPTFRKNVKNTNDRRNCMQNQLRITPLNQRLKLKVI